MSYKTKKDEEMKLPAGTTVTKLFCIVNTVGVIIAQFDTQEELDDHLRMIQPYVDQVQSQTIHKTRL